MTEHDITDKFEPPVCSHEEDRYYDKDSRMDLVAIVDESSEEDSLLFYYQCGKCKFVREVIR